MDRLTGKEGKGKAAMRFKSEVAVKRASIVEDINTLASVEGAQGGCGQRGKEQSPVLYVTPMTNNNMKYAFGKNKRTESHARTCSKTNNYFAIGYKMFVYCISLF